MRLLAVASALFLSSCLPMPANAQDECGPSFMVVMSLTGWTMLSSDITSTGKLQRWENNHTKSWIVIDWRGPVACIRSRGESA